MKDKIMSAVGFYEMESDDLFSRKTKWTVVRAVNSNLAQVTSNTDLNGSLVLSSQLLLS